MDACSISTYCIVFYSAREKFVRQAWEKAQVSEKWSQSSWAKKIEARQKVKTMFQFLDIRDITQQFKQFDGSLYFFVSPK